MYDFIYIDDAIASIIAVIEKGQAFHCYYIGSGKPAPLKDYLLQMKNLVKPDAIIGLGEIPYDGINLDYSKFDLGKVFRDTGYKNKTSFTEGIIRTVDYI